LVKAVFTAEDKINLRGIAEELKELRKLIEELVEKMVKLSDKELLRTFDASQDDLREKQIESYQETLEKQLYIAEKEFRP
jgi:hypothetical protein